MQRLRAQGNGLVLRAPFYPVALAALLAGAWLLLGPRTPDFAAQFYRAELFARDGFGLWDNNWYAGHHLLGYSLLTGPLAYLLGLRLLGALAAVASAFAFDRLARAHFGARAWLGVIWFAAATVTDLLIGRVTYGLGVAFGLAALLALQRRRTLAAAALAGLCAAASPVAGLFLVLAGAALALATRELRRALAVAAPALALVVVLAVAFPEGGVEPFAAVPFVAAVACTLIFLALVPREQRVLRVGAALYLVAVVASFLLNTPMGGNISRLGAMFAGPLLACAVWGRFGHAAAAEGWLTAHVPARLGRVALVAGAAVLVVYQWGAPVREVPKGITDPSVNAAYYQPLTRFLDRRGRGPWRIEVPFTRSHWEAALLAPRYPLARGWEGQLDTKYDSLFFSDSLKPAAYARWLRDAGVRFVALPDVPLDPSSVGEAHVIATRPAFLRPVWHNAHWQVFEFTRAQPLARGPGELASLGHDDFVLRVARPGVFNVRVHYSPYWSVSSGAGCILQGRHDWTLLLALRPGLMRVDARFSLGRVFSHGASCSDVRAR